MNAFRASTLLALVSFSGPAMAETLQGILYKSPYCTCCEGHADYLRENDVRLGVNEVEDLNKVSQGAGIPEAYQGCHIIFLGGYVIEGHVSIEIIRKLLKERPANVVGISLPGMPEGVPGMGGKNTGPYEVYAVMKDGSVKVFALQ
jgi:hypothetical protein